MIESDSLDRRILQELQRDNRHSAAELAELVNSSPPTCLRRVKRLRDEGIIVDDVALVDPSAIGRRLTMIVEVTLERDWPDVIDVFERAVADCEEVSLCYHLG